MVTTGSDPRSAEKATLLERYDRQIDWYWTNSSRQKKRFIYSRFTVLALGALVTLVASLAAATFVEESSFWDTTFKIVTPVLAAVLAVLTGLTQTFQWGAAWREMNLAAMALEKERDRIRLTPAYKVDAVAEIERFNDLVIDETRRYFERVTAAARTDEVQAEITAVAEAAVAAVLSTRPRSSVDLSPSPAATGDAGAGAATGDYGDVAGDDAYAAGEDAYAEDGGDGESALATDDETAGEEEGDGESALATDDETAGEEEEPPA